MADRRGCPRVEVSHMVLYSSDTHRSRKVAQTLDLSAEGTRIETQYSLTRGESVEISIAIHPQVITCRGQVVHLLWRDGERLRAGIEFQELSRHDKLFLGEYVAYVMEQSNRTALPL